MDEAQMILPVGIETTETNAREGVTLPTEVQKGEEDSLLLVERDRLRRGIFDVELRGDEPVERAVLYSLAHLLVCRDHVLCYGEALRCPLAQISPHAQ